MIIKALVEGFETSHRRDWAHHIALHPSADPKEQNLGRRVSPIIESRAQDNEASKANKSESHVTNKFPHGT